MLRRALPPAVLQYRRDRLLVQRVCELLLAHQTADSLACALNMSVRTLHRHHARTPAASSRQSTVQA